MIHTFKRFFCSTALVIAVASVNGYTGEPVTEGTPVQDAEEGGNLFTYGFELDGVSAYLWHGLEQSNGAVMQPWLWGSILDFTVSVWGNYSFVMSDGLDNPSLYGDRIDDFELLIDYENSFADFTFAPTLQFYFLPEDDITGEITLKVSHPLWFVDLYTSHTFDIIGYLGAYFGDIGLAFEKELPAGITISASTALGWASAAFNGANIDSSVEKWALNLFSADVNVTWYALPFLYIYPHCTFAAILDKDLQDALEAQDMNAVNFAGGLAVGVEF